jgi:hypothetical protein
MNQQMWGAVIISALVLIQFALCCFLVLYREVPAGSQQAALVLLGALASNGTLVVGYWVGSSAGSAQKTDLLKGDK